MSNFDKHRVSSPELFYDVLSRPHAYDPRLVYEELAANLDVPILGDDWQSWHKAWDDISEAMTMHESATIPAVSRSDKEIGKRILDLMVKHPWLARARTMGPRDEGVITAEEFCGWSANHVFDDNPGLFGISCREGWILRGKAQRVFYDSDNIDEELLEALELPRPLYPIKN